MHRYLLGKEVVALIYLVYCAEKFFGLPTSLVEFTRDQLIFLGFGLFDLVVLLLGLPDLADLDLLGLFDLDDLLLPGLLDLSDPLARGLLDRLLFDLSGLYPVRRDSATPGSSILCINSSLTSISLSLIKFSSRCF